MIKEKHIEGLFSLIVLLSIVFLSFLAGAFVVRFQAGPHHQIEMWFRSGMSFYTFFIPDAHREYVHEIAEQTAYNETLRARIKDPDQHIMFVDKSKTWGDLTLYSDGEDQAAHLIDLDGNVVHSWHLPFDKAWPNPEHIHIRDERGMLATWGNTYLYPNGDLLVIYLNEYSAPYAYGLAKIDKDSNLIWKYSDNAHHDVEVGPDGKIYTFTLRFTNRGIPSAPHIHTPHFEDYIVVLSPEGEELKKISIFDLLEKSRYWQYLMLHKENIRGDITHANDIDLITPEVVKNHPYLKPGQVAVFLRNIGLIMVVNLETEEVTWATTGFWRMAHDPDFLPNGNISIYDNQAGHPKPAYARILEFNPMSQDLVWAYGEKEEEFFFNYNGGANHPLPNGSMLFTNTNSGQILEVTRDGEIAWEFLDMNNKRSMRTSKFLFDARRYKKDDLPFLATTQTE